MSKIYKIIIIFLYLVLTFPSNAHIKHYENLNRIEFDIYRNNKHIGKHIFSFEKLGTQLIVESEINFEIKSKLSGIIGPIIASLLFAATSLTILSIFKKLFSVS